MMLAASPAGPANTAGPSFGRHGLPPLRQLHPGLQAGLRHGPTGLYTPLAIADARVVTAGKPKGALRRFLRWARSDHTARRVIATRYIPIREAR
jgi:hypothetical protein